MSAPATTDAAPVRVGRLPVYDRQLQVVGYQLVADGAEDDADGRADLFVRAMVDVGLDRLASGKDAIVALPEDLLQSGSVGHLPLERIIVDLPTVTTEAAIEQIAGEGVDSRLRWRIPDPLAHPRMAPVADGAHVIAVDVSDMSAGQRRQRLSELRARYRAKIEAAGVHDRGTHGDCIEAGFDVLSGTMLATPPMVSGRRLNSDRLALLRLVALLGDPESEVDDVELAVTSSPTLTYQVLRYVNSAHVGLRTEVESVRTAVMLLGPPMLRQLAAVLMLLHTSDRPAEASRVALARAEACAAVGEALGRHPAAFRTVGLLSTVDLLLGTDLERAVADLPLAPDVVAALLHHEGELGRVLYAVRRYADCDWDDEVVASFDPAVLTEAYFTGVSRADELLEVAATQQ